MDSRRNWRNLLGLFHGNAKTGFGIVEVMVSIVVLGFMYVALSKLQSSNHDSFLRIRGRDGAVEVAQQVLENLKSKGSSEIPSKATADTTYSLPDTTIEWERALGGKAMVSYSRSVTVLQSRDYTVESGSNFESVQNEYAKQVNVKVSWLFKGSTQTVNVSGVIQ